MGVPRAENRDQAHHDEAEDAADRSDDDVIGDGITRLPDFRREHRRDEAGHHGDGDPGADRRWQADPIDDARARRQRREDHQEQHSGRGLREDHLLARLPTLYLLLTADPADPPETRAPGAEDVIGWLYARRIELVYDPRTRSLRAGLPGAARVIVDRRAG